MFIHGKNRETNVNGYQKKNAHSVTGQKTKLEGEFITNVTMNEKTIQVRLFVMKNTNNLFGTHWMEQFKLWNSPISSFCQEIKSFTNKAESFKKELKIKFSEAFLVV